MEVIHGFHSCSEFFSQKVNISRDLLTGFGYTSRRTKKHQFAKARRGSGFDGATERRAKLFRRETWKQFWSSHLSLQHSLSLKKSVLAVHKRSGYDCFIHFFKAQFSVENKN